MGFIGAGIFSTWAIYPALHLAPIDLRAVCDIDEAKARQAAGQFGGAPAVPKELRVFPYPLVEIDDIYAVLRVLKNGILTGNKRKEREIAQFEARAKELADLLAKSPGGDWEKLHSLVNEEQELRGRLERRYREWERVTGLLEGVD